MDNEKRWSSRQRGRRLLKEKEESGTPRAPKFKAETDIGSRRVSPYQQQDSDMEVELVALQKAKEKANREDFDLLEGRLSSARVGYENAQLEVERMVP